MLHYMIGGQNSAALRVETRCYSHDWYRRFRNPNNNLDFVVYLKNDIHPWGDRILAASRSALANVLREDFAQIVNEHGGLTVCVVPRAKRETSYPLSQMGLKRTIRAVVGEFGMLTDGIDFIIRHTDTLCTHRARSGHGGNGEAPRPGLIRDTCTLSSDIAGKSILLVDDIYTRNVGIDEDAVQSLYDHGAREVIFYAVGATAGHSLRGTDGVYFSDVA